MSFNEDGTWGVAAQDVSGSFDWGTFTFDGEVLTMSSDPESQVCLETGTYEAAFTAEGDLELNVVEDPCSLRVEDLTGTLVPESP
jgi:hypothetical protein